MVNDELGVNDKDKGKAGGEEGQGPGERQEDDPDKKKLEEKAGQIHAILGVFSTILDKLQENKVSFPENTKKELQVALENLVIDKKKEPEVVVKA